MAWKKRHFNSKNKSVNWNRWQLILEQAWQKQQRKRFPSKWRRVEKKEEEKNDKFYQPNQCNATLFLMFSAHPGDVTLL